MKKLTVLFLTMGLMTAVCSTVFADSPAANEAAAESTAAPEQTDKEDYFGKWAVDGFNFVTNQVTSGWNTMTDSIVSGWNTMVDSILGGADTVGSYFQEQKPGEQIEEAWNTLKEGAEHQGSVAQEKLNEAYETVRNWFVDSGEKVDQEIAAAVDAVAGTAGVVEAQVSNAYRTIENFMVENSEKVTEAVVDSWNTIVDSSANIGSTAYEKTVDSYETLRSWIETFGDENTEEAIQALDLLEDNQDK